MLGLGLQKGIEPFTGVSRVWVSNVKGVMNCFVILRYNNYHSLNIKARVLPKITDDMPSCDLSIYLKDEFFNLAYTDSHFHYSVSIELYAKKK